MRIIRAAGLSDDDSNRYVRDISTGYSLCQKKYIDFITVQFDQKHDKLIALTNDKLQKICNQCWKTNLNFSFSRHG